MGSFGRGYWFLLFFDLETADACVQNSTAFGFAGLIDYYINTDIEDSVKKVDGKSQEFLTISL
jgi:hypothetical protein